MKKPMLIGAIFAIAGSIATAANAACFADYKAKRDDPLRLHYGVIELDGACTKANAEAEALGRLSANGWTLLTVLETFDDSGLDERKTRAGQHYLRY